MAAVLHFSKNVCQSTNTFVRIYNKTFVGIYASGNIHSKFSTISVGRSTKLLQKGYCNDTNTSNIFLQTSIRKALLLQKCNRSFITFSKTLRSLSLLKDTSVLSPKAHTAFYSSNKRFFDFNKEKFVNADQTVFILNDKRYSTFGYAGLTLFLIFLYMAWEVSHFKDSDWPAQPVDKPWFYTIAWQLGQYKLTLSAILVLGGSAILVMAFTRSSQAVRSLTLLKGGDRVRVTTFSPIPQGRTFEVPLAHISCESSRAASDDKGTAVYLSLKNRKMFVLLDKDGEFPNPELFDKVVGLKRTL